MRAVEDDHRRIRSILKDWVTDSPPLFPSMDLLKLLFWNCRNTGNKTFKRNLVEILRSHKLEILILMETKITFSKMDNFFTHLGFTASTIVDPIDRVGGIWLLWDTTQVNVRASSVGPQVIHATVHKEDYKEWVLAVVYASPNPLLRANLWNELDEVADSMDKSCSGPRMTWTNNRQGLANTVERLDGVLCNEDWRTMFPEATVKVLPRTYSDHFPLVVFTQGMHSLNPLNRPFRFEAAWMSHFDLPNIITFSWTDMHNNLLDSTSEFTTRVKKWNKEEGIKSIILTYFTNLFKFEHVQSLTHWNNITATFFTLDDNEVLLKPITNAEILRAVKSIGAFKALGKDGIQALFYQKYWHIVGHSVCEFVLSCFQNKKVSDEVNETLIVLIPKLENPEHIKQFRPISLCNVPYKIITKIIVGRIRPLLDTLISPNHSSFILGRSTADNIIITQEILHILRYLKGKKGGMIFKIDLDKAYDRISWDFIRDTFQEFKLNDCWIELIMNCVINTHSSVLWHDEIVEGIQNGRGIRQGDPLSFYLFVLCMERLSNMINSKVEAGAWKGIKASGNSPALTHLFFADDLILFAEANVSNCHTIMEVLNDFCVMSGQKLSLQKSKIFVSKNVSCSYARSLSFQCGISLTQDLGRYLGSPLLHSRINKTLFNEILEKLKQRLSGWKARHLSFAGRTTLIQAVTSVIPSYNMQTMELPRKFCDEVDRINRNFLWGDTDTHKKVHLINWDTVCRTKEEGGLGLRKARDNNAALLAKLGWKILTDPNKLWCKVLQAKYLKNNSIYDWPMERRASHIWKSICNCRTILRKGVKWNVGNGESISLWYNWWCGQQPLAHQYNSSQVNGRDKVSLLLDEEGNWNTDFIATIVTHQDLQEITKIHRPRFVTYTDAPSWIGTSGGNFSVASAHKLLINQDFEGRDWTWLWKIKLPHKLKSFLWLILHDRLLTNQMRLKRHMTTFDLCPRCGLYSEDLDHLLRKCSFTRDIWTAIQNFNWWEEGCRQPLTEWVVSNLKNKNMFLDNNWYIFFTVTLWQIWKSRNLMGFENVNHSIQVNLKGIWNYASEIKDAFSYPIHPLSTAPKSIFWRFPIAGTLKLNTDGCSKGDPGQAGYGGLLWDETGTWIWGYYDNLGHCSSVEAELWAIYRGLTILF
ncbi:uncharacterized protein LOC114317531 [Camellia sinensis]|uniref:uncharacterized protein LOC114317531 n=1 Tax=Camellia sinensis TaxID=4442 RepID=UPI001035F397|nr:uncharacterized protein LOC114317531 [Camellia sinensis]